MAKKDNKGKGGHSGRSHALLSASGAGRWMNCTPSARLEDEYGERTDTAFTREGTLAHELAELYLCKDVFGKLSENEFLGQLDTIMADPSFNEEMLDYVPEYTVYCMDQLAEARVSDPVAVMEIEQRLDLGSYIPDGFGTADCVILGGSTMEVVDLKYGKGVAVSAEWNRQLMIYGLGALEKFGMAYDISQVKLTIVQPRLGNISTFAISSEDLLAWAENELRPAAEKAAAGEGELCAGEWCRFCSVKHRCRALYEKQMEVVREEFGKPIEPPFLTDEEIAGVVTKASEFKSWVESVVSYATAQAADEGKQWPGLKLVEGRSVRRWALPDDEVAEEIRKAIPGTTDDDLYDMKLRSLTSIEKAVGKKAFADKLSSLVVKPQGSPVLVGLDDKRPPIGQGQAADDFAEPINAEEDLV